MPELSHFLKAIKQVIGPVRAVIGENNDILNADGIVPCQPFNNKRPLVFHTCGDQKTCRFRFPWFVL